jgi:hypothetical protein
VAEILHKSTGDLNPLWIQNRPTIDSDQFDPAIHGDTYGTDAEARLISGLLGHNVCFPSWGSPSPTEEAAGMTFHGETNVLRWQQLAAGPHSLKVGVTLPNAAIRFEREVRCSGNLIYFSEVAQNLSAWDRPVGWCEHVTLGAPFLEAGSTVIESSLTRGFRTGDESGVEFSWPQGQGSIPCMLTGFSATQHSDLVNSFLVDASRQYGYFVAWHPTRRLLFGYIFLRHEFPWMNVWESNDSLRQTRGMEFSNTPIDGSIKRLVQRQQIWGVPVYEWLNAKGKLRKDYAAFALSTPDGFRGVADVAITADKLNITEKETGTKIVLDWHPDTKS